MGDVSARKFSIEETFEFAWASTKKNFVLLMGLLTVASLVAGLPLILAAPFGEKFPAIASILAIISWVIQTIVTIGLIKVAIKLADEQKADFADLFSCVTLFLRYILASLIYIFIILGGLVLLVVPGIIWAVRFQFFPYFLIDKRCKTMESLKKSYAITHGARFRLFIFGILLVALNLAGVLAFFIGLSITIPITMIAVAYVYRQLSSTQPTLKGES